MVHGFLVQTVSNRKDFHPLVCYWEPYGFITNTVSTEFEITMKNHRRDKDILNLISGLKRKLFSTVCLSLCFFLVKLNSLRNSSSFHSLQYFCLYEYIVLHKKEKSFYTGFAMSKADLCAGDT